MKQRIALFGMVAVALIFAACDSDSGNNGTEVEGGSSSSGENSSSGGQLSGASSSSELSSVNTSSSSSIALCTNTYGTNTVTDCRDNQTYKTVTIGTQMWMAENLNYAVDSSWCYNNSADSCAKYGRLYQWAGAMGLSVTYNSTSATGVISTSQQGVCPAGWHIPTDPEWTILENAVGGEDVAGTALKSMSGWDYDGNGTDTYGFSALPVGHRDGYGGFGKVGRYGRFWAATEVDTLRAYNRYLYYEDAYMGTSSDGKFIAFSVRCLKN